jgi:hypothetical protein
MVTSKQLNGRTAPINAQTLREIVVVVPAHNERERLPACLASVVAAARQVTVPVTVVVVLGACSDRSEDVISGAVRTVNVAARNVGAARGGIRRRRATVGRPDLVGHDGRRFSGADDMVSRPGRPPSRLGAGCCRHGIGGLAASFGYHTATLRPALPCPRPRDAWACARSEPWGARRRVLAGRWVSGITRW